MASFKFMLGLLLAFAVFAAPVHAETIIEDAALVSHLTAKVIQTGTVSVSGSSVDWVRLNMTTPQNTESQKAVDTLEKTQDEFGNLLWAYEKKTPGNSFSYSGETAVDAFSRATHDLPASYAIPEEIKKYMLPTPGMQSDDGRIMSLAKQITLGKTTDFEKIAALASYVHNYVNYTKSLGTSAKDALWVLDNKIGTCDEYSALFIALARALEYPARYVSGYAYGDGGWIPHAWAEVYLGTWVPVDPTWLEAGWLDATHIQFHVSDDNKVENSALAYGVGTKTVDWVSSDTKIETVSADIREKTQKYSLFQTSETLRPGEKTVVVLRIFPEEYAAIEATLEPCRGSTKIASVENKTQEAVIMPGREKIMFWIVTAESGLPNDMIYTCPLVLNSRYLGEKRLDVKVDTSSAEESRTDISAELKTKTVILGENQTIFVSSTKVPGAGREYKLGVVSGEYYGESYAFGTSSGQFTYAPRTSGKNRAVAFASTGQVEVLEYDISQTIEGTRISSISVPAFAKVGVPEKISVTVKSPGSIKQSVRLSAKIDGKDIALQSFEVTGSKTITFDYAPDSVGEKTIRFGLSGEGAPDARIEKIRVYEVPELAATLSEDFGKNLAIVRIKTLKDTAENVSVRFLGEEKNIGPISGEQGVEFKITEYGVKEAAATFYDAAGNRHATSFSFDIKKESILHRIYRTLLSFLGK